jgi:hypothetical protein
MYVQQKKCGRVDISKTSHNDSKPTKTLNQLVLDNSISRKLATRRKGTRARAIEEKSTAQEDDDVSRRITTRKRE